MKLNKALCPMITLLVLGLCWTGCSKKAVSSGPLDPSSTGRLARYDLGPSDYDILPVTTFVFSYDSANRVTNVFEKSGQTLTSFSLTWSGDKLSKASDNNLGQQSFSYDDKGRIAQIDYTTITDTGKRVFSYNPAGLLTSVLDSVKKPLVFPIRYEYLFTYDDAGNNVTTITRNQLDLQGRPTLSQQSYYTFDDKPNPFTAYPLLMNAILLPGNIPALINKNNITGSRIVGTVYKTSGGSPIPQLDTISTYVTGRKYGYDPKGYPVSCQESFQDLQYNYSGNRNFTYDY